MYIYQLYKKYIAMPKTAPINMRAEPIQHLLLTKAAALLHREITLGAIIPPVLLSESASASMYETALME